MRFIMKNAFYIVGAIKAINVIIIFSSKGTISFDSATMIFMWLFIGMLFNENRELKQECNECYEEAQHRERG